MNPEPSQYVLDSFAILAFLQGEAGMSRVKEVLHAASLKEYQVHMSWINLGEVIYITERMQGLLKARQALARLLSLPIDLLEASPQEVLDATHIKATCRLSYADAFAVAAALEKHAAILTGDPEFASVEDLVRVEWLFKQSK